MNETNQLHGFQAKKPIVVVLGVHRSGTSLTTKVLNSFGVRLGDALIPGRSDNPTGFFEHRDILEQTRSLDQKLGVAPFHNGLIVPSKPCWWKDQSVLEEKLAVKTILRNETESSDHIFGFKDPRTIYQLPLWQEIFSELGLTPHYVLALRNVADTVLSISNRGIKQAQAEMIWLHQITTGLRLLPQAPNAVIHFERWFTDAETQGAYLMQALDLPSLPRKRDMQSQLRDIINPNLRHHKDKKLNDQRDVSSLSGQLYLELTNYASGKIAWGAVRSKADQIGAVLNYFTPFSKELTEKSVNLQEELSEAKNKIKKMRSMLQNARQGNYNVSRCDAVEKVSPRHRNPYKTVFPGLSIIQPSTKIPGRRLKICIATEDIVGPIRNGGIGTTYTHLSLLLAESGHDTTILYLRGEHCEEGTIEDSINWYRERGVNFVPVVFHDCLSSPAQRWIEPMYALYNHLLENKYDVVHASEWHGSAYLSLLAKRQGIAFSDTVFCIKSSSPWLWNREIQMTKINQLSDMVKMYAERKSIELADLVVGGSAYLLRWMLDHGYHLPAGRTFVQPNVVKPVDIPGELRAKRPKTGTRVPISEIVFFGRLEHRKGLDIFCDAINSLIAKGVSLPMVTFMGKFGARIPSHPELTVEQYIEKQTVDWPMPWQIKNRFNQSEALTYLHGEGRLAVIASLIENSPLTVYETTHFSIPFIASDVGGTSELIAPEHRKEVLTEPHPYFLARKIKKAVEHGGLVAAPNFDNDKNLGQWLNFHSNISAIIDNEGWPPESITDGTIGEETVDAKRSSTSKTSVCLVLENNYETLAPVVSFFLEKVQGNFEIILVHDGSLEEGAEAWLESLRQKSKKLGRQIDILCCLPLGVEFARNCAAEKATGKYILFIEAGVRPKDNLIKVLAKVAAYRGADVLMPLYDHLSESRNQEGKTRYERKTVLFLSGDPNFSFFDPSWHSPVLYVRKKVFKELGGFTTEYKIEGSIAEFIAKAVLSNRLVETVPKVLADKMENRVEKTDAALSEMTLRALRPFTDVSPLCYQPMLMSACTLGQQQDILENQRNQLRNQLEARIEQRDNLKKSLAILGEEKNKLEMQVAKEKKSAKQLRSKIQQLKDESRLIATAKYYFKQFEARSPRPFLFVFKFTRYILKR